LTGSAVNAFAPSEQMAPQGQHFSQSVQVYWSFKTEVLRPQSNLGSNTLPSVFKRRDPQWLISRKEIGGVKERSKMPRRTGAK
jgi:hypothetical protein